MAHQDWDLQCVGEFKKFVAVLDKKERKEVMKDGVVTIVVQRFESGKLFCSLAPGRHEIAPDGSNSVLKKIE